MARGPKTRTPRQERSRDKVEVIIEATTRILEERGRSALNTNAIAARAGVSVGTLYEYFANKEAIFVEMARRLFEHDQSVVLEALEGPQGEALAARARRAVRALIDLHAKNERVRRVVMEAHLSRGLVDEHARPVRRVAERVGALPTGRAPPSAVALFVLTRAVVGVIRSAMREDPSLLRSPEFEDELVRLVERYVA